MRRLLLHPHRRLELRGRRHVLRRAGGAAALLAHVRLLLRDLGAELEQVLVRLLQQLVDPLILGVVHQLHVLLHVVLLERPQTLLALALAVASLLARLAVKVGEDRLAQPLRPAPRLAMEPLEVLRVRRDAREELVAPPAVDGLILRRAALLVALGLAQLARLANAARAAQRERRAGLLEQLRPVGITDHLGPQAALLQEQIRELPLDGERDPSRCRQVDGDIAQLRRPRGQPLDQHLVEGALLSQQRICTLGGHLQRRCGRALVHGVMPHGGWGSDASREVAVGRYLRC